MQAEILFEIYSEVGRLRQVILHAPAQELEYMTPSNNDSLLFDDILFLGEAQEEHRVFYTALENLAIEVFEMEQLLENAVDQVHESGGIDDLIEQVLTLTDETAEEIEFHWLSEHKEKLRFNLKNAHAEGRLARVLIEGFLATPDMANYYDDLNPFLMLPAPNVLFMRDPAAVLGKSIIVSSMAKPARRREGLIMSLIANSFSAQLLSGQPWFDPFRQNAGINTKYVHVEGGDVLVIHDNILVVGMSERTTLEMLREVARRFIQENNGICPIETVFAVLMPKQRATMHLDTIFTMISEHECLIYPPMILPQGIEQVRVMRLFQNSAGNILVTTEDSLVSALQRELRQKTRNQDFVLTPIFCGGDSLIDQDREQWYDGANVLALAPGVVVGYDRNYRTLEALAKHGYEHVPAREVIGTKAEEIKAVMQASVPGENYQFSRSKYAISIPSSELSRARGGPRCMSLVTCRDEVRWSP